jgi:class 3 adenylate cyclase
MATAQVTQPDRTASAQRDAAFAQYLAADMDRFLTTILVTDIVESTKTVALLGDRRWRELLADHYADCRALVDNGRGELVNTTGDGIVAIFDAPTRAVRAGIAIQSLASESGLSVRAGVHTGELERLDDGITGLAIHIATRVCGLGGDGELIATATVRELAIGSLLQFESRGRRELRGVPGDFAVFRTTDPS